MRTMLGMPAAEQVPMVIDTPLCMKAAWSASIGTGGMLGMAS